MASAPLVTDISEQLAELGLATQAAIHRNLPPAELIARSLARGEGILAANGALVVKTGEPWITQDSLSTYGDMWIFKEALEKAASADRRKVAEAIRTMDTREGPAKYYPGGRVKFDEAGRREDADLAIVQWQDGVPVTVYPTASALAKPIWPKN